jgi:hypothetical protein
LASSSAHSLWPASPPQTPGFIGASPTRREGANLTSDIPSGIYFSAYGDRTPVQDVRQSDLLVALAAGQNGRDRPTMAFSAQVDLG